MTRGWATNQAKAMTWDIAVVRKPTGLVDSNAHSRECLAILMYQRVAWTF